VTLGGRAATSEVTDEVGRILAGRLAAEDRASLRSGDVRWRNRTAFARMSLVKRGEMDGATPRGIWAITDDGRARVEAEPA
jgi:Mrr N-terminal domain